MQKSQLAIAVLSAGVLLGAASNASAQCQIAPTSTHSIAAVSGRPFTVAWTAVPGAEGYVVRESVDGFEGQAHALHPRDLRQIGLLDKDSRSLQRTRAVTEDQWVSYLIQAQGTSCYGTLAVFVKAAPEAKSIYNRLVVPVAGSLTAADGTRFKTSVRLSLPQGSSPGGPLRGKIIFHPQGKTISDSDPSIGYEISADPSMANTIYWDDVVAAIGASGVGTLDIVPEGETVPAVEARVYNDARGNLNGDRVPVINPNESFVPNAFSFGQFTVWDKTTKRYSVGIRTFGSETIFVDVYLVSGSYRHIQRTLAPNTFHHLSLDQLAGHEVLEGETVQIVVRVGNGNSPTASGAYVYYTVTENSTNDPDFVELKSTTSREHSFSPRAF